MVLALRSLSFNPVLFPEDWKLAPEKDERDDRIERLLGEVRSLKANHPEMSLAVLDRIRNETAEIEAFVEVMEPDDGEIAAAADGIAAAFPMVEDFGSPPNSIDSLMAGLQSLGWGAPLEEEIKSYRTVKYPRWLDSMRNALPQLVARRNKIARSVPFLVKIGNDGFVNAEYVRLTISAYDGVLLLSSSKEEDEEEDEVALKLPSPPPPPRGRYASLLSGLELAGMFSPHRFDSFARLPPQVRDPNGFYFLKGRSGRPVDELTLTCDAFLHQGKGRELGFQLWLPDEMGPKPRIQVRLEANNLRKPIEKFVKVRGTRRVGDFRAFVAELRRDLG